MEHVKDTIASKILAKINVERDRINQSLQEIQDIQYPDIANPHRLLKTY